MKEDIIARIQFIMKDLRYTSHQLALLTGIDPSNLNKVFAGTGTVSQAMVDRLTDKDTIFQRGNTLVRINKEWLLGKSDHKDIQYDLVKTAYVVGVNKT